MKGALLCHYDLISVQRRPIKIHLRSPAANGAAGKTRNLNVSQSCCRCFLSIRNWKCAAVQTHVRASTPRSQESLPHMQMIGGTQMSEEACLTRGRTSLVSSWDTGSRSLDRLIQYMTCWDSPPVFRANNARSAVCAVTMPLRGNTH